MPPARLGDYLRRFVRLLERHHLRRRPTTVISATAASTAGSISISPLPRGRLRFAPRCLRSPTWCRVRRLAFGRAWRRACALGTVAQDVRRAIDRRLRRVQARLRSGLDDEPGRDRGASSARLPSAGHAARIARRRPRRISISPPRAALRARRSSASGLANAARPTPARCVRRTWRRAKRCIPRAGALTCSGRR